MRMKPLPPRPELSALLKENAKQFAALPQIERDAHIADQAASFVRGETGREPERPNYAKELIAARSTISEQEKWIAELEARIAAFEKHHEEQAQLISGLAHDAERNFDALSVERQRREELELVARIMAERPLPLVRAMGAANLAEAYFLKYEPGK